jgi:hypothetical protein
MKKIILFLFPFYIFALPSWFYKIKVSKPNYYIGYGIGENKDEAKINALKDIAGQINTSINSNVKIKKSVSKGGYVKKTYQDLNENIKANISDYEILEFSISDKYYMAIGYENIPNLDKFIRKLKKVKSKTTLKNDFLQNTYFAEVLKNKFGFFVDFKIYFKDGFWFISSNGVSQKLNKEDLKKLYVSVNKNLQIKLNKKLFYEGDEINVKIKSKQNGYVTLFDVTSNGAVYILMKNKKVIKNRWNAIQSDEFDLIASTDDKKSDFEMYVAVFSPKKELFNEFYLLSNAEENTDLGILIELLKKYDFATVKIVVKKRE